MDGLRLNVGFIFQTWSLTRGPIGRAVLGYVCFCNLPQVHSTRDVYNGAFSVDFGCVEWSIR